MVDSLVQLHGFSSNHLDINKYINYFLILSTVAWEIEK